ncbi:phage-related tail protein [Novosphingobium nitrogenifigens DSM 19370]|uniref:Phage-related tail protein n=1 Tax=Novosphingobium nitrogenifigens DSM 19370 TaxID=983920 RepID=F1Z9C0_9SPHN|nr:phage tail protein I [Novosphingobium nitrogenifigens]EGD58385.1 phage-related tail protein [Novosphingobium nitrogenifigens DSM 19370]
MDETLLPPNATPLETALAKTMAARLGALPVDLRALWNPQACPEALLPWLAWTLAVDKLSDTWPLAVRRARIASAIAIHRHKGTVQAIKSIIAAYGGSFNLAEWWQTTPRGDPYTFSLSLAVGGQTSAPSADLVEGLIADIERAKPARAHFTVAIATNAAAAIGLAALARGSIYARLSATAA